MRPGEPLRLIAVVWLLLGLSYIPWTVAIARMALHGTSFTVGTWTLVTPFAILGLAPIGAALVFWNQRVVGALVLAGLAVNGLLSQGILGLVLSFREGHPFGLFMVLLSMLSILVVSVEFFRTLSRAR